MKPKKENFNLKKVKLLKNGGIEIVWFETNVNDTGTHLIKCSKESPETPHDDLINKIKSLRDVMSECYGISAILGLTTTKTLTEAKKKALKALEKELSGVVGTVQDEIEVTSLSLNGEDAQRSVVISGKKLQKNRSYVAMNSPRIGLALDQFGFEVTLDKRVNEIKDEVFDYLYKNKKATPSLLDDKAA